MQIQHSAAVSLLVALGAPMAGKWNKVKLLGKLKKIDELVDDDTKLEDDDAATLKALRKANEAEEDIEIQMDEEGDGEDKPAKKSKKSEKASKKSKKAADEGDDDEDEKPAKKSKKGAKAKKSDKEKGPGVISSIVEFLKEASSKNPLSKEDLVKKLAKRFPDRGADSMKSTVNIQVPSRLSKDKGLTIKKNDEGYWIAK